MHCLRLYKEGNALPSVMYYITEGNRSIASKFCSAKQKIISFAKAKPYIAKGDVKIDELPPIGGNRSKTLFLMHCLRRRQSINRRRRLMHCLRRRQLIAFGYILYNRRQCFSESYFFVKKKKPTKFSKASPQNLREPIEK